MSKLPSPNLNEPLIFRIGELALKIGAINPFRQMNRLLLWAEKYQSTRLPDYFPKGSLLKFFALLNGAILSRAFAPTDWFWLIFLCIPIMIMMIQRSPNTWAAFRTGWWTGFGFFTAGLMWIGYSFTQQGPDASIPIALAPFAVMALTAVMAIYIAVAFALTRKFGRGGLQSILIFSAIWTLLEIARGVLFTGFPWHIMSSIWANWLMPLQSIYYIGAYGLSFVTIFIAGLWTYAFTDQQEINSKSATEESLINDPKTNHQAPHSQEKPRPNRNFVAPLVSIGLLSLLFTLGAVRLEVQETRFHVETNLRLVQPVIHQRSLWIPELWDDHFDKLMDLSRADNVRFQEAPSMVIWPESGIQHADIDRRGSIKRWRLSKLLDRGTYALVNAPRYEVTDGQLHYFNSLMAIGSEAEIYSRYDKSHLVPFGEYMPLQSVFNIFGLQHLTGGAAYSPGKGLRTIDLPNIPNFSPLICYEAIFPGAAITPHDRPDWILNVTNDGWFGQTEGPYQHLALARMRAVEEGLPLVRNAISGISAVIDPLGRILNQLNLGQTAILDTTLPMPVEKPFLASDKKFHLTTVILFLLISIIGRNKQNNNK